MCAGFLLHCSMCLFHPLRLLFYCTQGYAGVALIPAPGCTQAAECTQLQASIQAYRLTFRIQHNLTHSQCTSSHSHPLPTLQELMRLLRVPCVGGQKSKQEKKEAHKAKRRAKKGEDASAASSALLNSAPTAEALAAVGANQMSKAAAERQAEIDKNRIAWQQRTQSAATAVPPILPAASKAAAGAASDSRPALDDRAASQAASAGDASAARQVSDGDQHGPNGAAAHSPTGVDQAGDDTGASSSSSSGEVEDVDTAGSAQVVDTY